MKEQNTKDIQSNIFMLYIKIFAWCTILVSIGYYNDLYLKTQFMSKFFSMAELITYMGGAFIIFIISDESKKNLNKLQKFSLYFMLSASLLQMILFQNHFLLTFAIIFLASFPALIVLLTIRKKELKLINMPFFFIFSFLFSIIFNGKFVFLNNIINLPTVLNSIIEIILFALPTIYFLCTMDYYLKFKTPKVRFYTVLFSILCLINIFMLLIKIQQGVVISDNLFWYFRLSILALAVYIAYKQKDDFIRLIKGNSKLIKGNTKHEE